jgi:hypothetical protein
MKEKAPPRTAGAEVLGWPAEFRPARGKPQMSAPGVLRHAQLPEPIRA